MLHQLENPFSLLPDFPKAKSSQSRPAYHDGAANQSAVRVSFESEARSKAENILENLEISDIIKEFFFVN